MAITTLRLEADDLEALTLSYENGWAVSRLDLGDPETRDVVHARPGAHGTTDTTEYIGARTVTIAVKLVPTSSGMTAQEMRQRLRAFTAPSRRPTLFFSLDGQPEQMVSLRRGPWNNAVEQAGFAPVVVQWVAPLGIIESAEIFSAEATGSDTAGQAGRAYSLTFSRVYPSAFPEGSVSITNEGDLEADPLILMYGPATNPAVRHLGTDQVLSFTGLTIAAGDFVEVDARARTIRYNGNENDSRYDTLDFSVSEWWRILPGEQRIRYEPDSFSAPAAAVIYWRHTSTGG